MEQCQGRFYKRVDCQGKMFLQKGKMRKWSRPMKRCLGPGKCLCWKETRLDTTHLADNLEDHGRQRHHMPGWETAVTLGEEGKGGGVSVSVTALLCLSRSQCLRTQSAPIPTVSHLLRLLFSATTESYFDPLSLILHFCLLYIALLSPSFSERPPSLSDRNASH